MEDTDSINQIISADAELEVQIASDGIEKFLALIRDHPCIYDKTTNVNHLIDSRANAFLEISYGLQEDVSVTENRWKKFLNRYHTEKNLREFENRSGSGLSKRTPWVHFDVMHSFMKNVTPERRTYSNVYTQASSSKSSNSPQGIPPALATPPARQPTKKPSKTKNDESFMLHALNKVDSAISQLPAALAPILQAEQDLDEEFYIGKLVELKLNQLSPAEAKRKANKIERIVIDAALGDSD